MLNVGAGAYEIRIHVLGEWRVIYQGMQKRKPLALAGG